MPSADDIQSYLWACWRLMTGRADGLRSLDLSVDGFWNSFFAIIVSLPALIVGWVVYANHLAGGDEFSYRVSILAGLAFIDLVSWIAPIVLLALVVGPAGLRDRFVPYVVASNWASVIFTWLLLPPSLLELFWPASGEFVAFLTLGIGVAILVLAWRLTNTVIARGAGTATAVFAGMLVTGVAVQLSLQTLLGLVPE
ncbi:MAG: transporter [Rhizobiaceae bacterium]|nr:transporter [Rhizobiaceae bacterium]